MSLSLSYFSVFLRKSLEESSSASTFENLPSRSKVRCPFRAVVIMVSVYKFWGSLVGMKAHEGGALALDLHLFKCVSSFSDENCCV